MLLAICVLFSMMSHEVMSAPAPAPAPTDLGTLLLVKVLGLAGLKGNFIKSQFRTRRKMKKKYR